MIRSPRQHGSLVAPGRRFAFLAGIAATTVVALSACVPEPGPGGGTTTTTTSTTTTTVVGGACDSVQSPMNGETVTVSTFAGGADTDVDGIGTAAGFSGPHGLTIDRDCQLLVADEVNSILRSVTASGAVTTIAGRRGFVDNIDGPVADAFLVYPIGVAADSQGNTYISQSLNGFVRKLSSNGIVSTFATGSTGGPGPDQPFNGPTGLAVDGNDNLFVADTFNHVIRRVTPSGVVTTLAGSLGTPGSDDGTGADARFFQPTGVTADDDGNVYVADRGNRTIRKVTSAGVVTTIAGTPGLFGWDDGTGDVASFVEPRAIALGPDGRLYVADSGANLIRRVTTTGVVTTLAGAPLEAGSLNGPGVDARFNDPRGIAVAADGTIYVADGSNRLIRSIVLS